MLDFNLERFKQLPVQPGAIWQGGVFRVPAWGMDDGDQPRRPWMALWANPSEPRVSQPRFIEDEEPAEAAVKALIDFALEGGRRAHRPFAIEVMDSELAAGIEQRLQGTRVRVDRVKELPGIRALLDDMAGHMNKRKEPPGALSGKGVGLEQMEVFAESAVRFHKAQLWEELSDDDLIQIEQPAPPPGMRFTSVLGHGGETFGLGFFDSLKDYEKMRAASTPGRFFSKNGAWSLMFGDITELPFADADLWEDHDLPVSGPDGYPCVLWFGPKRALRRPGARELEFLNGLLHALAETTSEDLDTGRWSQVVAVGGSEIEYRLALVNEVNETAVTPGDFHQLRRVMERGMANLQREMDEHDFASLEEANAFLQANINIEEEPKFAPRTPLEQAQDLMYDAWDATGRRGRTLVRKALEICPDCADAYVFLAEDAADESTACSLYRQGVEAGERALGPAFFRKEVGHFWGLVETRPYMRARFGLAQVLWLMGQRDEAVSHYEELLRLNPIDNQGVRYFLAACLLELGDDEKLGKLLDAQEEDGTAQWRYLRALWCYRREGDTSKARKLAKTAIKSNAHVPNYLSGKRRLPTRIPDAFHLGEEDEAICCASELRAGWKSTPGAVEWLNQFSS